MIKIIESPREAMQGIVPFIETTTKVEYINALLKAGFDSVEVGSLVSARAVPQMSDTLQVLDGIRFTGTSSKKMLLVVNTKGASTASEISFVDTISYPFSISQRFSQLNMNSTSERQLETVSEISEICTRSGKSFVVYISMAFGNPYEDEWNLEILVKWVEKLKNRGIQTIPLSNVAIRIDKTLISEVFTTLIPLFPEIEFGLHLHTSEDDWYEKVEAAYTCGCRRFDSVMLGMGGCPMTGKELLGNLATENLVRFLKNKNEIPESFNESAMIEASRQASVIFQNTL